MYYIGGWFWAQNNFWDSVPETNLQYIVYVLYWRLVSGTK